MANPVQRRRSVLGLLVAVSVAWLASCSDAVEPPPTIDAPVARLSGLPPSCAAFDDLAPTSLSTVGLTWNDDEAPAVYSKTSGVQFSIGGVTVAVSGGGSAYTSRLTATGDVTWESEPWPMDILRIVRAGEVLVASMYWHQQTDWLGDGPGQSERVIAGIGLQTGRMLWWIPQTAGGYYDLVAADAETLVFRHQVDSRDCAALHVADAATGAERWTATVPSCSRMTDCRLDGVALDGGHVFARATEADATIVVAWDVITGETA